MDIIIRKAQIRDISDILKMNEEFNGVRSTFKAMKYSLENNNELVYVAVDNDKAIGFICGQMYGSICYQNGLQGELTELFVDKEYRQRGVATKLIKTIEDELIKSNVQEIYLKTGLNNKKARKLYEKCGYFDYEEVVYKKEIDN